jgi:hypothetical protein
MLTKRFLWQAVIGATLLAGIPATTGWADEPEDAQVAEQAEAVQNPQAGKYRIGLGCTAVPEALRVQLQLPEGYGLLVSEVLEDSPAARAGFEKHDIILEGNGAKLSEIADLIGAVDQAGDKEMTLKVIRRGDEREIHVTPEPRTQEEDVITRLPNRSRPFNFEMLPEEVRQWMEKSEGSRGPVFNWRQFGPGIVIEDFDNDGRIHGWAGRDLPDNFSLRIEKNDQGPAHIHVQRGDERWEVTEDNLDALPEDLRPVVEGMLSGSRGHLPRFFFRDRGDDRRQPRFSPGPTPPGDSRVEQQMNEMSLRIKELQEAIESLRSQK